MHENCREISIKLLWWNHVNIFHNGAGIKDCNKGIHNELGLCWLLPSCSFSCSVIHSANVGDEAPSEMETLRGLRRGITVVMALCLGTHLSKQIGKCWKEVQTLFSCPFSFFKIQGLWPGKVAVLSLPHLFWLYISSLKMRGPGFSNFF